MRYRTPPEHLSAKIRWALPCTTSDLVGSPVRGDRTVQEQVALPQGHATIDFSSQSLTRVIDYDRQLLQLATALRPA